MLKCVIRHRYLVDGLVVKEYKFKIDCINFTTKMAQSYGLVVGIVLCARLRFESRYMHTFEF